MQRGRDPRPLVMRLQSRLQVLAEVVVGVVGLALVALLVSVLLMALGLGVRGLSDLVGAPLPYVRDDPDRIEWGGLGELVGYGIAGALALYGVYLLTTQVLPASAQRRFERLIGVAALLALAVSALVVAIEDRDLRAMAFGIGCGYLAYRLARGSPLDEEEHADAHDARAP